MIYNLIYGFFNLICYFVDTSDKRKKRLMDYEPIYYYCYEFY